MDQGFADSAELVAEFKGLRDWQDRLVGFSVRWHGPSRQWVVDLRPFFTGTGEPDGLRTLAEAVVRGAHDRCEFVTEPVIANDGRSGVEASLEATGDGTLSLVLFVFYEPEPEIVGVGRDGVALYGSSGNSLIELGTDPAQDASQLVSAARALLNALDRA
jgi:hypothetical protein